MMMPPRGLRRNTSPPLRPKERSRVFTLSPDAGRGTKRYHNDPPPPRGTRHPQSSPPSAPKRGSFARSLTCVTPRYHGPRVCRHQIKPLQIDLGDATAGGHPPPGSLPACSLPSTEPRLNASTTATSLAAKPTAQRRHPGPSPDIRETPTPAPKPVTKDFNRQRKSTMTHAATNDTGQGEATRLWESNE